MPSLTAPLLTLAISWRDIAFIVAACLVVAFLVRAHVRAERARVRKTYRIDVGDSAPELTERLTRYYAALDSLESQPDDLFSLQGWEAHLEAGRAEEALRDFVREEDRLLSEALATGAAIRALTVLHALGYAYPVDTDASLLVQVMVAEQALAEEMADDPGDAEEVWEDEGVDDEIGEGHAADAPIAAPPPPAIRATPRIVPGPSDMSDLAVL